LLAKKQTEDHLDGTSKREMAPEDVDWKDQGFTQEESKPTVHVTPKNDYRPTDQGFEEAPIDLTRGTNEGYQAYDGPDTSVLEKEDARRRETLAAPNLADHHVFPQQFRRFFEEKGINIDDYTVTVGESTHLKGLHGKGIEGIPELSGRWNQKWSTFVESNPDATAKEIYQFGGKLMDEYKLSGINLHGYKK